LVKSIAPLGEVCTEPFLHEAGPLVLRKENIFAAVVVVEKNVLGALVEGKLYVDPEQRAFVPLEAAESMDKSKLKEVVIFYLPSNAMTMPEVECFI
jgi:hypothetical protein